MNCSSLSKWYMPLIMLSVRPHTVDAKQLLGYWLPRAPAYTKGVEPSSTFKPAFPKVAQVCSLVAVTHRRAMHSGPAVPDCVGFVPPLLCRSNGILPPTPPLQTTSCPAGCIPLSSS